MRNTSALSLRYSEFQSRIPLMNNWLLLLNNKYLNIKIKSYFELKLYLVNKNITQTALISDNEECKLYGIHSPRWGSYY